MIVTESWKCINISCLGKGIKEDGLVCSLSTGRYNRDQFVHANPMFDHRDVSHLQRYQPLRDKDDFSWSI